MQTRQSPASKNEDLRRMCERAGIIMTVMTTGERASYRFLVPNATSVDYHGAKRSEILGTRRGYRDARTWLEGFLAAKEHQEATVSYELDPLDC